MRYMCSTLQYLASVGLLGLVWTTCLYQTNSNRLPEPDIFYVTTWLHKIVRDLYVGKLLLSFKAFQIVPKSVTICNPYLKAKVHMG